MSSSPEKNEIISPNESMPKIESPPVEEEKNAEVDNNNDIPIQSPLDTITQSKEEETINKSNSTLYPREKFIFLQSILERGGLATKPTEFTLEVYGVYSLPDFLLKLDASGAVDAWPYQLKVGEAVVQGAKINPRELTEDEKKEQENKKKGPPKVDKKNPDAMKEEMERLEKERLEKEEQRQKILDELNALEPMERFYTIKEMTTNGEWISFNDESKTVTVPLSGEPLLQMEDAINESQNILIEFSKVPPPDENEKKRPKPKNINPEDVKPVIAVGLADLSEFHIVPGKKEVILRTPLLLKETYEKRKENGMPIVIPFDPDSLNLSPFVPSVRETENPKGTKENKATKENQDTKDNKDEMATEKGMSSLQENEELDYIEKAHTYVYYKLSFSEPINPKLKKEGEKAQPNELIKTKQISEKEPIEEKENEEDKEDEENKEEEKKEEPTVLEAKPLEIPQQIDQAQSLPQPQLVPKKLETIPENEQPKTPVQNIKPIAADEICYDFRKYIKIFISSICKSYDDSMGDSNKGQTSKRDKGVLSNAKREERDSNISKFQQKFIDNGRAEMIKEKLKKFIIRIAIEKYKKRININQTFAEQKDKFFSELYAYICDEIKLGMDEFVHIKKDELHEHILSSYEQSRKEIINYAIRQNKEPEEKRLLRLSKEYEMIDDLDTAMRYYKSRLTLIQNKDSWLNFAILAKKMNSYVEVEEAINNCIAISNESLQTINQGTTSQNIIQSQINEDFNLHLLFSAMKYLKGRIKDSIDILLELINKYQLKGTNCNFNAFLAFLYHEKGNTLNFIKHYEAAKRFKMIELGINLKKPKINLKVKNEYKRPTLPIDQTDNIWYSLINMFNEYQFFEISEKLLEFIDSSNKNTIRYLLEKAKIYLFKKDNENVIKICDSIIEQDPNNYHAWIIRGHAFYLNNNLFDSEESYVKGIRCKPQNEKYDIKMLSRLGIIYIRRKTCEDAKTIFLHILKEGASNSFAWRYLGLALTRLGEFEAAEEALNETILLDIENTESWAYMTMFCIEVGRKRQAYECLNEILKMNYNNIEVISEIAQMFHHSGDFEIAADLYKRIINIEPKFMEAHFRLADIYYLKYENKKEEAIAILKNALNYATDEKEKNSILQLIEMNEKQMEYRNNNILDVNDNEMNITGESNIQKDNEANNVKDSFEHPFFNE